MTYLYATTAYILFSPLLAAMHIANIYLREFVRERRRQDEILELGHLYQRSTTEPERTR